MSEVNTEKTGNGSVAGVFITFLRLGLTSFGGPVAHLGYFHKEIVQRQRWIGESQFSQLLAICQFLPGPASSQLGFAIGLLRAGWLGAIAAFIAFTLPSALLLVGFASLLSFLSGPLGEAAIHGLKIVAFAVVADAVLGMSKKLCPDTPRRTIAIVSASALLLAGSAGFQLVVVLAGGIAGVIFCRESTAASGAHIQVGYGKRVSVILFGAFLSLLTVFIIMPESSALVGVAEAFYRAGSLVFGGGHVVLPLLEDSVVTTGLVSKENFLAGYGAAQAMPGPMFAFSAYLGAIMPTGYDSGVGALVALIFMFLPGFLLVAAALPMWQAIAHNPTTANVIAGVNAAVVGLLGAALYDPIFTSGITSGTDLAMGIIAFAMLVIWQLSPLFVVIGCVGASMIPVMLS